MEHFPTGALLRGLRKLSVPFRVLKASGLLPDCIAECSHLQALKVRIPATTMDALLSTWAGMEATLRRLPSLKVSVCGHAAAVGTAHHAAAYSD